MQVSLNRTFPGRPRPAYQWPASVLNGLTVGLGLACLTAAIGALAGMPAAITAASGASATSVADTVCAPQAKRHQMLPAVLGSVLVAALVALTHTSPWGLTTVVLLTIFTSIFWMSWGKRGGPQTFVMVLSLVFQMAAFSHQTMDAQQVLRHLAWVAAGAVGMALWAELSIRVMARRYRTLALADALDALAAMMSAQAQWTLQHQPGQTGSRTDALLRLIRQQAGIADVFQTARDLLYSQATRLHGDDRTQRQIQALIHIVNLRDVVQACQLDLDQLPDHEDTSDSVQALHRQLREQAAQLKDMARAWRQGMCWTGTVPSLASWSEQHPVLSSLGRRCRHMLALTDAIAHTHRCPSAPVPTDANEQAAVLRTLVSPSKWTLAPLRAQFNTRSPVLRYALRATLAVGCADGIAHLLPWSAHPHWILMTVAVVMRGNLEQTLARRDARIQGTLVGCVIASMLLLGSAGHTAWLFAALAAALSLAHGFVLINYRVTAAAGAVLALVQGHMFSPSHNPALVDAAERLGDTLIGAGLAWAFSYVLPSWERQQLPKLVGRLLAAETHYAHHALRWHEQHARSPERSHARREVYDVLWLVTQSLQRMSKEPRHAKAWAPHLETMLLHSHRLISHLAAIKGLLTVRHEELVARRAEPALRLAEARIHAALKDDAARSIAAASTASSAALPPGAPSPDEPPNEDATQTAPGPDALTDWLLLRLEQTTQEARLAAGAAHALARQLARS